MWLSSHAACVYGCHVTRPIHIASATRSSASRATRNYARIAEQTWIWSVVGYTVLRFFIAWGAFSDHGVNVWIFGLLDVGTAWPYAKAVAAVCTRAADSEWKKLPLPLAVAISSFGAPYAYLWFAAGEMPAGMRVAMIGCVTVLLAAATLGVLGRVRKIRREAAEAVVDLTSQANAVQDQANAVQDQANAVQDQANAVQDQANAVQDEVNAVQDEANAVQDQVNAVQGDVIVLASVDPAQPGDKLDLSGPPQNVELLIDLTGDEAAVRRAVTSR